MGMFDEFVTGVPDPTYAEPEPAAPQIPLPRPRPGAEFFAAPAAPQPGRSMFDEFVSGAPTVAAPVTAGGVDWSRYNQPMGELKPWQTVPSEDLTHAVQDQLISAGANPFRAKQLADISVTAARMHPLINAGVSAADLPYHAARGEKVAAALDALGVAPAGLAARRMYQGASPMIPLDPRATLPIADTPLGAIPPRSAMSGGPVDVNQVSLMQPREPLFPSLPTYNLGTPRPPGAPLQDELQAAGRAAYQRVAANPTQWDPRAMNHYIDTSVKYLQQAGPHGTPHIEQNSPEFYDLMEKWWQQNNGRTKPVTSAEWDALRQQLFALPTDTQSGAAGLKAVHLLDNYILNPAGTVSGTVQDLDRLRRDLFTGRGNYRDFKTAQALEKDLTQRTSAAIATGQPTGPAATDTLNYFANTDAGINSIYAKPEQRAAIRAAAESNPTVARWIAGNLGGQTAASLGSSAGGALGYMLGGGPMVAGGGALVGGAVPKAISIPAASLANARERQTAEELIAQIRRGSPLYAERSNPNIPNPTTLPTIYGQTPYRPPVGEAPIADPRSQLRDAIAYALTPQVQREGKRQFDLSNVPYEQRDVSPPLSEEQP